MRKRQFGLATLMTGKLIINPFLITVNYFAMFDV